MKKVNATKKVKRTPLEILRCQAGLLGEIVQLQKKLLVRRGPVTLELPESIVLGGKVSLVCPKGMTQESYRRALVDVFLAASKAVA